MRAGTFKAFRLHETGGSVAGRFEELSEEALDAGDVLVRVEYSSINYKDALACTGTGAIARRFPIIAGIDLAGEVLESESPDFSRGDAVFVCGSGLSESRDGGYSELARLPAALCSPLPDGLDTRSVMAIGTAGLAAALAVDALEQAGVERSSGPVAVTGATGGVGAFAVDMLAARGFDVTAITGKPEAEPWLRSLGAANVLGRADVAAGGRPLAKAVWAGAVDNLGGDTLASLIATTLPGGALVSVGLAASPQLPTTVLPFILRGVKLLGVNSVTLSRDRRTGIWRRIATDLKPRHLDTIVTDEIAFDELPGAFAAYLEGKVRGRAIVRVAAE
jgi:acrylyl-CoA reductase (NADPH)